MPRKIVSRCNLFTILLLNIHILFGSIWFFKIEYDAIMDFKDILKNPLPDLLYAISAILVLFFIHMLFISRLLSIKTMNTPNYILGRTFFETKKIPMPKIFWKDLTNVEVKEKEVIVDSIDGKYTTNNLYVCFYFSNNRFKKYKEKIEKKLEDCIGYDEYNKKLLHEKMLTINDSESCVLIGENVFDFSLFKTEEEFNVIVNYFQYLTLSSQEHSSV
ncbi:hypothetical protein B9G39_13555 [Zooshikella ganghwensis]|uniref:Uncharacterized protein n=2 Tax=Zooshikella ganghwensis TaxID=202772 RepID=A0A4P9VQP8_9GAMM|nr:hypothetical protein B9G39_13555 [Zooshikella ganghwensis]